mmetsp:Transcript_23914/g.34396  ORF Transcript_23914/g.34396 Transcript_23914/m.34396 type:complete len:277 (-) Transcript_23914:2280-3110(-)
MVLAIRKWSLYLDGQHSTVPADHNPLRFLRKQTTLMRRQERYVNILLPYSFDIQHIKGSLNIVDALSRDALRGVRFTTEADWSRESRNNDEFSAQFNNPMRFEGVQRKNGLLCMYARLCVPRERANEVIDAHHNSVVAGYFGATATYRILQRRYYWPSMRQDVHNRVRQCEVCAREQPLRRHQGELHPLPIPEHRTLDWTMDLITGFPSVNGADAILVVVDRFTKFVVLIPTTKTMTAEEVARLIVSHIISLFGFPRSFVTDRDKVFTTKSWQTVM